MRGVRRLPYHGLGAYAGAWLPGFGGLLDRVDGLIVTTPLVYHLLRALT